MCIRDRFYIGNLTKESAFNHARILCDVLNREAVSYTHLDVYKRQALYSVMSVAEQSVIALWHALLDDEDEWEKNGGWSVSYTHLDVYKRQECCHP